jgi:hypothetical protein
VLTGRSPDAHRPVRAVATAAATAFVMALVCLFVAVVFASRQANQAIDERSNGPAAAEGEVAPLGVPIVTVRREIDGAGSSASIHGGPGAVLVLVALPVAAGLGAVAAGRRRTPPSVSPSDPSPS